MRCTRRSTPAASTAIACSRSSAACASPCRCTWRCGRWRSCGPDGVDIHFIYGTYIWSAEMGIVKISDLMHDNLRDASDALSRSINSQAEHWLRVGMLAELHPELNYGDICQL